MNANSRGGKSVDHSLDHTDADPTFKRMVSFWTKDKAQQGAVTLSREDAATVREAMRFALETLSDVIERAEKNGQRTGSLQAYRADIADVLGRVDSSV